MLSQASYEYWGIKVSGYQGIRGSGDQGILQYSNWGWRPIARGRYKDPHACSTVCACAGHTGSSHPVWLMMEFIVYIPKPCDIGGVCLFGNHTPTHMLVKWLKQSL